MSRAASASRCAASRSRRSPRPNALPSAAGDALATTARAGVLGLQGDFAEHLTTLRDLGVEAIDVRRPEQLDEIDALIIPGGESTTIGKLAAHYGIIPKLKERAAAGMPVWGTCAGAIFIATDVPGHPHPLAGLMGMSGARKTFGRQGARFEGAIDVGPPAPAPLHAWVIPAAENT